MSESMRRLRVLLPKAKSELAKFVVFSQQLEAAQRRLDAGDLDDDALFAIYEALPPKWKTRAGAPADDSLTETRQLVNELNQLIRVIRKHG